MLGMRKPILKFGSVQSVQLQISDVLSYQTIEKLMNAILCPRGRSVHGINTRLAENRLGHKVLVLV